MAEKNQDCREAAEALYEFNQDEVVRQQCRAREDYYIREKVIAKKMEEKDAELKEKDALIIKQEQSLEEKDMALQKKDAVLEEKDAALQASYTLLVNSVKSLIERLHISEEEACEIIGISIEDYHSL